jgi:WD repeat-containing protein 23
MTSLGQFLRSIRGGYEEDTETINSDDNDTDSLDHPPATEHLEEGSELLASGEFGRIGVKNQAQRNPSIVKTILRQRSCAIPVHIKEDIHSVRILLSPLNLTENILLCFQNLVPNTNGITVANYDARIYTASFSKGFLLLSNRHIDEFIRLRFFFLLHMLTR